MTIQNQNDPMVTLLSGEFQRRYEPNFAWQHACSMFQALPGLRLFVPFSSADENGNAIDLSGQGRTLTYNGGPKYFSNQLEPHVRLDGQGDFFSRVDEAGLDILGTESYIHVSLRGLAMGGWFQFDNVAGGGSEYCLSKYTSTADQRSYGIRRFTTGTIRFGTSPLGVVYTEAESVATPAAGVWVWLAGRLVPGATKTVWVNLEQTDLVTADAAIFNSNAPFLMGGRNAGAADLMTGRASLCFLCAAALSDTTIAMLYEQTRALFGQ